MLSSILKNRIVQKVRGRLLKGFYTGPLGKDFLERWIDISLIADFRPTDTVLDVGCAEGLISAKVAKRVANVHAIDVSEHRVRLAKSLSLTNVTFEVADFANLQPKQPYDVTLLLSVLGKSLPVGFFGLNELAQLLNMTARQSIIRVGLGAKSEERGYPLEAIYKTMDDCGFDSVAFPRPRIGNLIIGNRRGSGARLNTVPPLTMTPTALYKNPCLTDATIGTHEQFR